jgi:L-fuculose-phosphate aldolase
VSESGPAAIRACKDELLATAKEMLRLGLVVSTDGNISTRLPDGNVAMTPSSLDYNAMTLEDLVVVDMEGNVLEGSRAPTSEKDLHLACLRRHSDIHAVMHSHAMYSSMFAITRQPIPALIEEFEVYVGGDVRVAEFAATGSAELGEAVAECVGDRAAVLMANHGLLTVGKNLAYALKISSLVERIAQIVWGARQLGEIVPLPGEASQKMRGIYPFMGRKQG